MKRLISMLLVLNFSDKINLTRSNKYVALSNLSINYTWKNIKSHKLKILAPTWNDILELPDRSYSLSDIQDYFEYITKRHDPLLGHKAETPADNPPITIYVNKTENRLMTKIKTDYDLEPLTPETMKLLGSTENKISKDKKGKNVSHLEITKVVLAHCNVVNN